MPRALVGVLVLLAAGCGGGLPRTFPASGKVVHANGKPMTGGTITFSTTADPLLRVFGTIGGDGTFTLATVKDNAKADGAPAGEYQVTVQPPVVHDPRGGLTVAHKGVPPIRLPRPYRLEEKPNTDLTVTLPAGS